MLKIRRPLGRLIFNMGIAIPGKTVFLIETAPWSLLQHKLLHIILNTLRQRQNGCHFPDDIFKWIFLNENVWISLKISSKFVPKVWINNIPALVQIMAWRRPGHKPLSEPMMVQLLAHIYVSPGLNELNKIVRITMNVCNKKHAFSQKNDKMYPYYKTYMK